MFRRFVIDVFDGELIPAAAKIEQGDRGGYFFDDQQGGTNFIDTIAGVRLHFYFTANGYFLRLEFVDDCSSQFLRNLLLDADFLEVDGASDYFLEAEIEMGEFFENGGRDFLV